MRGEQADDGEVCLCVCGWHGCAHSNACVCTLTSACVSSHMHRMVSVWAKLYEFPFSGKAVTYAPTHPYLPLSHTHTHTALRVPTGVCNPTLT